MAAGDFADVEAAAKVVYDNEVKKIMPEQCAIQENTDFSRKELSALGRSFNFPVEVQREWGFSQFGTAGAANDLNDAQNGVLAEASIKPYESWFYGRQSFVASQRTSEAGKKAIVDLAAYKMKGIMSMHRIVTEIQLLHGTDDIGVVDSLNSQTMTLKARSSSPAILALLKGAIVDVKQSNGTTARQSGLQVTDVDTSPSDGKYTITCTGTMTGIQDGDRVFLDGGSASLTGTEMPGLNRLAAIASGTVWGVSADDYPAWRGKSKATFGLATVARFLKEHIRCTNDGGSGEYWLNISPDVYQNLANDESAKQLFDSSYSENKLKGGTKSLQLFTPSGASLTLMGHPFQKEGKAVLLRRKNIIRLGSSDHTMELAGQELVRWANGTNYMDFASFTDQCVVLDTPAHNLLFTGVTVA